MRRLVVVLSLAFVAGYVFTLLRDAGVFKTIYPHYFGEAGGISKCRPVAGLPGPEDIVRIGSAGLLVSVSPFPRFGERAAKGSLVFVDLASASPTAIPLMGAYPESFHPHGIDALLRADGTYRIAVVNHAESGGTETDEIDLFDFDPKTRKLAFRKQVTDPLLGNSANDLVLLGEERFYVTEDHAATSHLGKTAEDFLRLSRGSIVYFDGARFSRAYSGIAFANGLVRIPTGEIVVASMLGRRVLRFAESTPGTLSLRDETELDAAPDNLFYEPETRVLWIGAHPKLLKLKSASKNAASISPSSAWRIPNYGTDRAGAAEEIFADEGNRYSALSVAITQAGSLVFGSVYADGILVCPVPKATAGGL